MAKLTPASSCRPGTPGRDALHQMLSLPRRLHRVHDAATAGTHPLVLTAFGRDTLYWSALPADNKHRRPDIPKRKRSAGRSCLRRLSLLTGTNAGDRN